jgi:hypothetical protein
MSARSRSTKLVWPVQVAALLLATLASGCVPQMYSYLDESPSASVAELQAAWDARFPPGTARADLLADLPPLWPGGESAWRGFGTAWFVSDHGLGSLTVTSAANQLNCNAYVDVDVTFDAQERIVESVARRGGICL